MEEFRLACVGIACIDVIQEVDGYPVEDTETRVKAIRRARGGNATNTLVTAAQLPAVKARWIGVMLAKDSGDPGARLIQEDLVKHRVDFAGCTILGCGHVPTSWIISNSRTKSRTILHYRDLPELTLEQFTRNLLRGEDDVDSNGIASREILGRPDLGRKLGPVGVKALPYMELSALCRGVQSMDWIHFECRNAKETLPMMRLLRALQTSNLKAVDEASGEPYKHDQAKTHPIISLEVEKDRGPLADQMVALADVVIAPQELGNLLQLGPWRAAAGGEQGAAGAPTASSESTVSSESALLRDTKVEALAEYLVPRCRAGALLVTTWGDRGAVGLRVPDSPSKETDDAAAGCSVGDSTENASAPGAASGRGRSEALAGAMHVPAWLPAGGEPVDTVGAGDTFIAGCIWGLWYARHREAEAPAGDAGGGAASAAAPGEGGAPEGGLRERGWGGGPSPEWRPEDVLHGLQCGVRLAGAKVCRVGFDGVAVAAGLPKESSASHDPGGEDPVASGSNVTS